MYDLATAKAVIQALRNQDIKATSRGHGSLAFVNRKWDSIEMVLEDDKFSQYEAWQEKACQALSELELIRSETALSNEECVALNCAREETKRLQGQVILLSGLLMKASDSLYQLSRRDKDVAIETLDLRQSIHKGLLEVQDIPF